ncbi:hypothetical protein QYE76_051370 [Lolium multiflorum]|uniref:Uncharacterized protein n=1 Tax=Lolium multiflorum TaxID=4521 RepID=A0AAD8SRR5_LOLMU|nr:hypothetical protein QYE76_051370 [Lolium multiflorum]
MVKKKNPSLVSGATSSGAAAKAPSGVLKRGTLDASAPAPPPLVPEVSMAGPVPGDWPASTTSKHDEKRARSLGIISADEGNVIHPAEEANVLPLKRSSGDFADEDDLDLDEAFIEPPPKKTKRSSDKPAPAASEASDPSTAPAAQVSTASFLFKGKEIPSTAAAAAPPSEKPDFRAVISSLEAVASQFTSLEADKARLQKEVESTSSKLENAIKMAAEARQNADSLTEELDKLKSKLKDEEASKLATEAEKNEKDSLLRQSVLALLKAADISVDTLGKLPDDSPIDVLTLALESNKLIQALLEKNKGIMSRLHSMIFPKADQHKTLGQLTDVFAVDTKGTIEVIPMSSFTEGPSNGSSEKYCLERMKSRIAQMEKGMRGIHAMAAIIKKKGELATDAERYALMELHKATESLNSLA